MLLMPACLSLHRHRATTVTPPTPFATVISGMNIGNDQYLDDLKLPMDKHYPYYHAHGVPQQDTPNDGSIFTAGPAGLSYEFHGTFDYSKFDETKMIW